MCPVHSEAKETEMEFGAEKGLLQGDAEMRWLTPGKALSPQRVSAKHF